jgi:Zn-dependent protease
MLAGRGRSRPALFFPVSNVIIALLAAESGLLALGAVDLRRAGIFVICMILAIAVHEFSHAFAAHRLGDPLPEGQGRLTLNPVAHMDPLGTLLLPLGLAIFSPGLLFGWGRPVQTEPRNYTRKVTMRGGMAIVSIAGPLSNLVLAALTLVLVFALSRGGVLTGPLTLDHPLLVFYFLNIVLFVFNLLPIHPLDGGKVLAWFLGPKYQHVDDFLMKYGGIILLVLVFGFRGVLGVVFEPFYRLGMASLQAVI